MTLTDLLRMAVVDLIVNIFHYRTGI